MPYLKIVNGRIVEADPHSADGHGMKIPTIVEEWGDTAYSNEHIKASQNLEKQIAQDKIIRSQEDQIKMRNAAKARRLFLLKKEQERQAEELRRSEAMQLELIKKAQRQGVNLPQDFKTPLSGHALSGLGCPCNCMTEDEHRIKAYRSGNLGAIPSAMDSHEMRQHLLRNKLIQAKVDQARKEAMLRKRRK